MLGQSFIAFIVLYIILYEPAYKNQKILTGVYKVLIFDELSVNENKNRKLNKRHKNIKQNTNETGIIKKRKEEKIERIKLNLK